MKSTAIRHVGTQLFAVPLPEILSDARHGDHTHFELITCTVSLDDGVSGTGYTYTGGKGGTTRPVDVYRYAEPVTARGFVFMDTPGYDPASVTGEVAGGANVVCFTTGRGSVFGYKPAPSIKLATNSAMYERLAEDMDIDCGEILSRGVPVPEMGERIFRLILDVASGAPSKSEALGFGDNEFTPWVVGAVM